MPAKTREAGFKGTSLDVCDASAFDFMRPAGFVSRAYTAAALPLSATLILADVPFEKYYSCGLEVYC